MSSAINNKKAGHKPQYTDCAILELHNEKLKSEILWMVAPYASDVLDKVVHKISIVAINIMIHYPNVRELCTIPTMLMSFLKGK